MTEWTEGISIHAAREGGDVVNPALLFVFRFQSTPPVKAATPSGLTRSTVLLFQSTPPVKAATQAPFQKRLSLVFQSTPPVKAATCTLRKILKSNLYFNPRRP